MNLTLHLMQKDLRHLRWYLAGWVGLIVLGWLIGGLGLTFLARDTKVFQYLGYSWQLISLLNFLLFTLVIVRLVQSDSQVGTTAFWMTRPISRSKLLGEKLLFLGLFLIALPVGLEILRLRSWGGNRGELWAALSQLALWESIAAMAIMTLASLTNDLARFVSAAVLSGLALYLDSTMVMLFTRRIFAIGWDVDQGAMQSSVLLTALLSLLVLSLLLSQQYFTRKVSRGVILALLALPLIPATSTLWKWDFLGYSKDWMDPSVLYPTSIHISIEPEAMRASADYLRQTSFDEKHQLHRVGGGLTVQGSPPGVVLVPGKGNSELRFFDGTVLKSRSRPSFMDAYHRESALDPQVPTAIESVLGGSRLLNPLLMQLGQMLPVWVEIDEDSYQKHESQSGTLSGEMEFEANQWELLAKLPGFQSAAFQKGLLRFGVMEVFPRSSGCRLQVRKSVQYFLFQERSNSWGDFLICALHNSRRQEILLGREWYIGDIGGNWDYPFFRMNPLEFLRLRCSLQQSYLDFDYEPSPGQTGPKIDRQWLAEAETILLRNHYMGRIKKSFRIENFVMNPSPPSHAEKSR